MPAVIDTRASKLDLTAPSGDDIAVTLTTTSTTWLDGETLSAPVETTKGVATGQSFTTSWNAGTLTLTLSDTQTTALGVGVYRWRLTGTEAGVTTTHIAGQLSLTAQSSATGTTSVSGTVTVSATPTVTLTVQGSALGTITDHLADTVDAHDASAISVLDTGGYYTGTDVEAVLAEISATPSTTTRALVELATNAEALARTDTQRAVTPANLSQFTTLQRYNAQRFMPTGALGQTLGRQDGALAVFPLSTGRQSFQLAWLPAGTYNSITFISSGTAAVSPTNQWFSIYDGTTRAKLAVTADDTTTAWGANAAKTLTISGGVTLTEGLYYIGVMVTAATPPSLYGYPATNAVIHGIAPVVCGPDTVNVGLTTPATAPATAAAPSASGNALYAYLS